MISNLLNIPRNPQEWAIWSLNHRISHDTIVQAINARDDVAVKLQMYLLDPIPMEENGISEWLGRNGQAHSDMNGVLKLPSVDLQGIDFQDEAQLKSWIYLHYQEHLSAQQALGI